MEPNCFCCRLEHTRLRIKATKEQTRNGQVPDRHRVRKALKFQTTSFFEKQQSFRKKNSSYQLFLSKKISRIFILKFSLFQCERLKNWWRVILKHYLLPEEIISSEKCAQLTWEEISFLRVHHRKLYNRRPESFWYIHSNRNFLTTWPFLLWNKQYYKTFDVSRTCWDAKLTEGQRARISSVPSEERYWSLVFAVN